MHSQRRFGLQEATGLYLGPHLLRELCHRLEDRRRGGNSGAGDAADIEDQA